MRNEENWVRNDRKKNEIWDCENQQKKFFDSYYKIGDFALQTAYLCELIIVSDKKRCYSTRIESRRNKSRWYHLPDTSGNQNQVCKIFFKNTLNVSDGRISRALVNNPKGETASKDERGRQSSKNKKSDIKVNEKNETLDIETARELNQRKAESARQRIREDAELAKIVNYNLTATAFDLMKSLPTPVLSTGVCYYKRQLWTYCFEIHNLATQEAVTEEKGSSRTYGLHPSSTPHPFLKPQDFE
ncbi:Reverse transcriptase domain-containing protein [Aphis craccivora]|uniref:Reverse transcriptase domain-containing protein n=1 Tax=Aphis craccivora TaxID=307492 RepID=A0A6G0YPL5_APHCR|nr:Reverse transcriptase domain-containing protein [Aphis craccivora]